MPVIDLYTCVEELIKELGETDEMQKKQADFMAKRIREIVGKEK